MSISKLIVSRRDVVAFAMPCTGAQKRTPRIAHFTSRARTSCALIQSELARNGHFEVDIKRAKRSIPPRCVYALLGISHKSAPLYLSFVYYAQSFNRGAVITDWWFWQPELLCCPVQSRACLCYLLHAQENGHKLLTSDATNATPGASGGPWLFR